MIRARMLFVAAALPFVIAFSTQRVALLVGWWRDVANDFPLAQKFVCSCFFYLSPQYIHKIWYEYNTVRNVLAT